MRLISLLFVLMPEVFLVKNFAIPVRVHRNTIRSLANTLFQGLSQWPKNATIVKQWVPGFDQRSLSGPTASPQSFTGRVLLKINKIKIHLTPTSLSFVKVIFPIKKLSFLFFHGSKKKLKINQII